MDFIEFGKHCLHPLLFISFAFGYFVQFFVNRCGPHNLIDELGDTEDNNDDDTDVIAILETPEADVPEPIILNQGTIHQGLAQFIPRNGKQCTAICSVAIAKAAIVNAELWTHDIMDDIVKCGDSLYKFSLILLSSHGDKRVLETGYIQPEEVLNEFQCFNKMVTLSVQDKVSGAHCSSLIDTDVLLLRGLRQLFSINNFSGVLLTSYGYTVAVWKSSTGYWLFDSHARNMMGKVQGDGGVSFCGCYSTLKDVCLSYYQNFRDVEGHVCEGRFELTPISVNIRPWSPAASIDSNQPQHQVEGSNVSEPAVPPRNEDSVNPEMHSPPVRRKRKYIPRKWVKSEYCNVCMCCMYLLYYPFEQLMLPFSFLCRNETRAIEC